MTVVWASLGSGVIGALIGAFASIGLLFLSERLRRRADRATEVRARSERAAVEALDLLVQLRDLDDEPEMGAPGSRQTQQWEEWRDRRFALIVQLQVRAHMVADAALRETLEFVADVLTSYSDIENFAGRVERVSRYFVTQYGMEAAGAVLRDNPMPAEPRLFADFRNALADAEVARQERERR